jgi:broad specificity phosphatase PhoE
MTRLYLVRHGETDWNAEARWQGQLNPSLNEQGRRQARQLAQELACEHLRMLYSSDLTRAMETARIVRARLIVMVVPDSRLREINLGLWQGMLANDIQAQYPREFQNWYVAPLTVHPPGGEDLSALAKRVVQVINEIVLRHPNEAIGVIAHELPIAIVLCRAAGLPLTQIRYQTLEPGEWKQIHLDAPLS